MTHVHGRAIILLEGLDKCGKSTMAADLAVRLTEFGPVNLVHFGTPNGDQFREYLEAIRQADAYEGSTIIDRLHWSEEAYGRTYRPDRVLETASIDALDEVLRQAGGVVVWKRRDLGEVLRALDAHDQRTKGTGTSIGLLDLQAIYSNFNKRHRKRLVASTVSDFRLAVQPEVLQLAADLRTESIQRREQAA